MSYPADSTIDFVIDRRLDVALPKGFVFRWGNIADKENWINFTAETMGHRLSDNVINQFFGNGKLVLFCYSKSGELVGTCGWVFVGNTVRLNYTAVRKSFRRQGLASSMVSFVVNNAIEQGHTQVEVQTTLNRPEAMRLYMGLGFKFIRSKYPVSEKELVSISGITGRKNRGKRMWSRIGNEIAGWWIDLGLITEKSTIYSFGLGSDISFELELIKKKGCIIHGFDPTPGIIDLWKPTSPKELLLYNCGLDATDCKKKMIPLHEGWATYTVFDSLVVGKDNTRAPQLVELKRLQTIMADLRHYQLDVLKIDIEGCEYAVIDDIIKSKIKPKVFMIEWHVLKEFDRDVYTKKIEKFGYNLGYIEGINYTFVRSL